MKPFKLDRNIQELMYEAGQKLWNCYLYAWGKKEKLDGEEVQSLMMSNLRYKIRLETKGDK